MMQDGKERDVIDICRQCGQPLQNGQQDFCGSCKNKQEKIVHTFDSACAKCGALLPSGKNTCLVCHTARSAVSGGNVFPMAESNAVYPSPQRDNRVSAHRTLAQWRRWGLSLMGGFLALLVVIGSTQVYNRYFDTSVFRARDAVIYEEDGQLMLTYPDAVQPVRVNGVKDRVLLEDGVQASPSGRWLALTGESGTLYQLDFTDLLGDNADVMEAQQIAEKVQESAIYSTTTDYLVYLNQEGGLYASYLGEIWQLDTGVVEVVAVEERRVLYMRRGDKPGQLDLYLDFLPKDGGQWHVVDRDISEVLDWSEGFEQLLYTGKRVQENGETETCLQMFDLSKSTTSTLAVGVDKVLDASAEQGSAVFLSATEHVWRYTDFLDDDIAFSDTRMREPLLENYPQVHQMVNIYGDDEESMLEDMANDEALLEEYMAYRDDLENWQDKQERDALRQQYRTQLSMVADELVLYELYTYQNGALTLLDVDVLDTRNLSAEAGTVNAERNYATYQRVDPESVAAEKLSAVWEAGTDKVDIVQSFLDNAALELCYTPLNGTPIHVFLQTEEDACRQWRVSPNADGIYFLTQADEAETTLYYAPLRSGELQTATAIQRGTGQLLDGFRDGILLEAQGGAYLAQGETVSTLSAALPLPPVQEGASLLMYYGPRGEQDAAPLYMLTREERQIATEAVGCWRVKENSLYFARAAETAGKVDLYFWQPAGQKRIAANVQVLETEDCW